MSRYGISTYGGTTKYGPDQVVGYGAAVFNAVSEDYGAIRLTWSTPDGEWNRFVLVRNPYGFPVDTDDGEIVFENTDGSAMPFPDTNISQGRTYYYAIFVQSLDTVWHLSATTVGVSVKDFGTYNLMWYALPLALRSRTRNILDASNENKDLSDFVKILAFQTDTLKTLAFLLRNVSRPEFIPRSLLPLLVNQLGLEYEPAIGDKQVRSLANNIIRLYQEKGSYQGLLSYVKYFSGYDSRLEIGKNLLLDYNTSSFEEDVDLPVTAGATVETVLYDGVTPIVPLPYTALVNGVYTRGSGYLKITSDGTESDITYTITHGDPRLLGIPVEGGEEYTFSLFTMADSVARDVTLSIDWYDWYGNYVTTSLGIPVPNALGSWGRSYVTATAHPEAKKAVLKVTISGASNGEIHYIDAAQLEVGGTATDFEDARLLKIVLLPNRINELLNPNFTVTADYWNVNNYDHYEIVDSADVNPHSVLSGTALEVYPATLDPVEVYSDELPDITPNEYHTFSIYFSIGSYGTETTTYDAATASIVWFDSSHTEVGESAGVPLAIARDLQVNWEDNDTILQRNSIGIESDTLKFKVGDGLTGWNLLPYASDSIIYSYKLSSEWTGLEVLGLGVVGVETDTYKFKVGDGMSTWADLDYTTSLPAWCRPYVTALSPENAAYAVAKMSWEPSTLDMAVIVDEALFEKSPGLDAFFDGDIGIEDASGLIWEGLPHGSRSLYYRNYASITSRLTATLPEHLTLGSTFGLYYSAE